MIFGMVAHVKITYMFLLDSNLLPVTSTGETKSGTCDGHRSYFSVHGVEGDLRNFSSS